MTSDEIEFLPKKYREKRKNNSFKVSRLLLVVVLLAGMGIVLLYQLASLHSLNLQVAAIDQQNTTVMQLMQEVELRRAEVEEQRHHAKLLTFLDHTFPKSQIIAAITNPLPPEITIIRLQISAAQTPGAGNKLVTEKGKEKPKGHPMQLDLKQLIEEATSRHCTVEIEGTTDDTSCLYPYLASLHQAEVVESAKIESIDPHQKTDGTEFSNFTAHVKIRRGYLSQFETLVGRLMEVSPGQEGIR